MVVQELVLDREVRNWVLLPLTACVLLMQLLRQYVSQVGAREGGWATPAGRGRRALPLAAHHRRLPPCRPPACNFVALLPARAAAVHRIEAAAS